MPQQLVQHVLRFNKKWKIILWKRPRTLRQQNADGPFGIAFGKLGAVCAGNWDPRLVLGSTICGMNGCCHLPEKQRLPNLRHVSHFLSSCPPLQEQWQGASIDIKAAQKRMPIKENERGALLFQVENKTYAAHIRALRCKN